jgi:pilus assembly protein Flp/PilA
LIFVIVIGINCPVPEKEFIMKLHKMFTPKSQKGVTMIEYALIAALIAVVAVTALTDVGAALVAKFNAIKTAL